MPTNDQPFDLSSIPDPQSIIVSGEVILPTRLLAIIRLPPANPKPSKRRDK